jgi:hypothetical protein
MEIDMGIVRRGLGRRREDPLGDPLEGRPRLAKPCLGAPWETAACGSSRGSYHGPAAVRGIALS